MTYSTFSQPFNAIIRSISYIPSLSSTVKISPMSSYFKNTICTQGRGGDIVFLMALGSFNKTSPAEFAISSDKAAENGKGCLVRGYNTLSETIRVNLKPL
jgi:hypothetical protein